MFHFKHNLGGLITKSSNWVAMGKVERSRRQSGFGGHSLLFWLVFLGLCTHVHGVTCNSCFDGIEGCAGGDACLFTTRTAANLVAYNPHQRTDKVYFAQTLRAI